MNERLIPGLDPRVPALDAPPDASRLRERKALLLLALHCEQLQFVGGQMRDLLQDAEAES